MSITKSDIVKNIAFKTELSTSSSSILLKKFLNIVSSQAYKSKVKIPKFGLFEIVKTPTRTGRNPKTLQQFKITERSKFRFKPSSKIKSNLN